MLERRLLRSIWQVTCRSKMSCDTFTMFISSCSFTGSRTNELCISMVYCRNFSRMHTYLNLVFYWMVPMQIKMHRLVQFPTQAFRWVPGTRAKAFCACLLKKFHLGLYQPLCWRSSYQMLSFALMPFPRRVRSWIGFDLKCFLYWDSEQWKV